MMDLQWLRQRRRIKNDSEHIRYIRVILVRYIAGWINGCLCAFLDSPSQVLAYTLAFLIVLL
jgi:uncharacterized membrane protein YbjE (DUF340 family)